MNVERFVYYRVAAASPALRDAVIAMQRSLRERHPQLQARLLYRAADDGTQTWMEIYAQPGGVGDELLAEIEALAADTLAGALLGERHVESFTPCAS